MSSLSLSSIHDDAKLTTVEESQDKFIITNYPPDYTTIVKNFAKVIKLYTANPDEIKTYIYRLSYLGLACTRHDHVVELTHVGYEGINNITTKFIETVKSHCSDTQDYSFITKFGEHDNNSDTLKLIYVHQQLGGTTPEMHIELHELIYFETTKDGREYKYKLLSSEISYSFLLFTDEECTGMIIEILNDENLWKDDFNVLLEKCVERVMLAEKLLIKKHKQP